jgi:hypothetical protein
MSGPKSSPNMPFIVFPMLIFSFFISSPSLLGVSLSFRSYAPVSNEESLFELLFSYSGSASLSSLKSRFKSATFYSWIFLTVFNAIMVVNGPRIESRRYGSEAESRRYWLEAESGSI